MRRLGVAASVMVATGAAVVALSATPAAAAYPDRAKATSGRTASATCASNGSTDGLLTSPRYTYEYGAWKNPGGLSTATCDSGWWIVWTGVIITS
ncbi:hypothetical protein HDA40_001741 [Hamadaea flava]|uniref:Secreted protein n=1 Tax=Hamadaea flava TaxID=1742688 RepID=A0ABV8LMF5_9ACTN|nr:hypothetical protein [Hamadaea flava]MCP2323234.1 hypothetical protein [Hamadaea flava]